MNQDPDDPVFGLENNDMLQLSASWKGSDESIPESQRYTETKESL